MGELQEKDNSGNVPFFLSDLIYFVTLRKSHFWLDSDLEVEALREDSLRLLAICSWRFSLASFILLAKSLAPHTGNPHTTPLV